MYMRRVLKANFRKKEIEDNLLLPKDSIEIANIVVTEGTEGYIEFTAKLPFSDYKKLSSKNLAMLNAYKYRKKRK